jgi:hypothetical protein
MMYKLKHNSVCAALVADALSIGGYATVNPRPDYNRTVTYVAEATGRRLGYRLDGNGPANRARVEELLRDGLSVDEAVAQRTLLRLRPVLMTATVASRRLKQPRVPAMPATARSSSTTFRKPSTSGWGLGCGRSNRMTA